MTAKIEIKNRNKTKNFNRRNEAMNAKPLNKKYPKYRNAEVS